MTRSSPPQSRIVEKAEACFPRAPPHVMPFADPLGIGEGQLANHGGEMPFSGESPEEAKRLHSASGWCILTIQGCFCYCK